MRQLSESVSGLRGCRGQNGDNDRHSAIRDEQPRGPRTTPGQDPAPLGAGSREPRRAQRLAGFSAPNAAVVGLPSGYPKAAKAAQAEAKGQLRRPRWLLLLLAVRHPVGTGYGELRLDVFVKDI